MILCSQESSQVPTIKCLKVPDQDGGEYTDGASSAVGSRLGSPESTQVGVHPVDAPLSLTPPPLSLHASARTDAKAPTAKQLVPVPLVPTSRGGGAGGQCRDRGGGGGGRHENGRGQQQHHRHHDRHHGQHSHPNQYHSNGAVGHRGLSAGLSAGLPSPSDDGRGGLPSPSECEDEAEAEARAARPGAARPDQWRRRPERADGERPRSGRGRGGRAERHSSYDDHAEGVETRDEPQAQARRPMRASRSLPLFGAMLGLFSTSTGSVDRDGYSTSQCPTDTEADPGDVAGDDSSSSSSS